MVPERIYAKEKGARSCLDPRRTLLTTLSLSGFGYAACEFVTTFVGPKYRSRVLVAASKTKRQSEQVVR
jgi:hypothetical protein